MTLTELKELRDQVRGLTGADREVDARLAKLAGWTYELNVEEDFECWRDPDGRAWYLPQYTNSTDAALAFSEKVLPGVWYILAKGRMRHTEPLYACELLFGNKQLSIAEADTLPHAIIDATLTALIETME